MCDFVIEYSYHKRRNDPDDFPGVPYGVLKEYRGPGGEVVIPDGVTSISDDVFRNNTAIKTLYLPDGLKYIFRRVFEGCTGLVSVRFPDSLLEIDNNAFEGCTALEEVILPETMKRIGNSVFQNCTAMKKLTVPGKLERVDFYAFTGLDSLQEMVIPCDPRDKEQVKFFATNLLLLDELRDLMMKGAIKTCAPLEKAMLRRVNTAYCRKTSMEEFLGKKDAPAVAVFLKLIPKMPVEELDGYLRAAENQTEIRALILEYKNKLYSPADLVAMENDQAEKELGLKERTVADWKKIYKINAEGHITGYKRTDPMAEVPYKVRNTLFQVGAKAFFGCEFLESVTIAEGVTLIDRDAFFDCSKLSEITIPSTLEKIGASAFRDCVSLTHVRFPGSVKTIGANAFTGCTNLTIHAPAKSKIIKYAAKNGISYVEE